MTIQSSCATCIYKIQAVSLTETQATIPLTPFDHQPTGLYHAVCNANLERDTAQRRTEELVKMVVRMRTVRDSILGAGMAQDAAWSMLLDLFMTHAHKRVLHVTGLCAGAGASLTTALRKLEELSKAGLVRKHEDRADRRRVEVHITDKGVEEVMRYVERLERELRNIGVA